MPDLTRPFDVLVVGGGNAGLCAAITARRAGARVLVLESAIKGFRGGNSRHTRNIRYMHKAATDYVTGAYSEQEFWRDLLQVTGGETNEQLARLTIRVSEELEGWMSANGVRWQRPLRGTLHLSRTNVFMLGGGKAMMNAYYDTASRLGVQVAYETEVHELKVREREIVSAVALCNGAAHEVKAKAVVIASGGFEANIPWLKEYWGDAAENFIIRGTKYNQGRMLKELLNQGAKPVGDPRGCHAVALDARAPKFDGGIVTRLDSVPLGIVVNNAVKRFYDEGEDFWPKRYAIWGGLIAGQPDQIAYSVVDAKALPHFMPSVFPPVQAHSIPELATALGLNPPALVAAVDEFNRALLPGYGYPLRPGITFTYLGVTVDEQARVIMQDDRPAKNIFAAGEVMAGNILRKGYLGGFGLTIGSVFGRIAGREAARHAGG
jgi:tricarballylate dehydrogenase